MAAANSRDGATRRKGDEMRQGMFGLRSRLGLALGCLALLTALFAPGSASAALKIEEWSGQMVDSTGQLLTQAGAHADVSNKLLVNEGPVVGGPGAAFKDVYTDLPQGLAVNPSAVTTCSQGDLSGGQIEFGVAACSGSAQVGILELFLSFGPHETFGVPAPLYNVTTNPGEAGRFAANIAGVLVSFRASVRSDGDYGVTALEAGTAETLPLIGAKVTMWGVPADVEHDPERVCADTGVVVYGCSAGVKRQALVSNPTACTGQPLRTGVTVNSWEEPSVYRTDSYDHDIDGNPLTIEGCNQIDFTPSIEARPTTNLADSPSGLDVKVHIPQNTDPDGLAEAHLRDATIVLPEGMTINPASAQGLGACSPAQIGLTTPVGQPQAVFNKVPAACPSSSKLGTVRIDTPLLNQPLLGNIYLGEQGQNPFGSLLSLYISVDDPVSGIVMKLAGQPVPDPKTGRLAVTFANNPQVPFEDLRVNMFTGPRAALKTPMACGNYTTASSLVPWTSPEGATATPSDSFGITKGPGDSACVSSEGSAPNKPSFSAGSVDPGAAVFTPFTLRLARADGTQPLKSIDATLPKGLLGKLVGIPYCSDAALAAAAGKSGKAEQASPSCPSASQVGSVTVGAGAGSNPVYVEGKAYLAGPYKGAPLSLAIVTPAVSGPFDLGTVVVRNALQVNPETAQIHAVSDDIPTILQGIPLDIRSISVRMDRQGFTLNPTNCNPTEVLGGATSVFNQTASLSNRFQVGGCQALGFKPKLAIDLTGPTKRTAYPALKATLTARPGDANIGKAVVALPHSEFLAQEHIKTICTRVQFAANQCPPGSIYGKALAYTPLLDRPLQGPVYLRSSSNKLPDMVVALNGQIDVDLVGRIDSVKGGIRTSFESVPDAPVTKFVLEMEGGQKGLLVNSRNLCNSTNKASVQMDGQNGKTADSTPVVTNDCKVNAKKKKKAKKHAKGKAKKG